MQLQSLAEFLYSVGNTHVKQLVELNSQVSQGYSH